MQLDHLPVKAYDERVAYERDSARAGSSAEEAAVMRKIKGGWSKFGVDDPWFVVHPERVANQES